MALYFRSVTKNRHDHSFLLYLCLRVVLTGQGLLQWTRGWLKRLRGARVLKGRSRRFQTMWPLRRSRRRTRPTGFADRVARRRSRGPRWWWFANERTALDDRECGGGGDRKWRDVPRRARQSPPRSDRAVGSAPQRVPPCRRGSGTERGARH